MCQTYSKLSKLSWWAWQNLTLKWLADIDGVRSGQEQTEHGDYMIWYSNYKNVSCATASGAWESFLASTQLQSCCQIHMTKKGASTELASLTMIRLWQGALFKYISLAERSVSFTSQTSISNPLISYTDVGVTIGHIVLCVDKSLRWSVHTHYLLGHVHAWDLRLGLVECFPRKIILYADDDHLILFIYLFIFR